MRCRKKKKLNKQAECSYLASIIWMQRVRHIDGHHEALPQRSHKVRRSLASPSPLLLLHALEDEPERVHEHRRARAATGRGPHLECELCCVVGVVLCCVVLCGCGVVLCCVVLWCVVLCGCGVVLCCGVLCCVVLFCVVLFPCVVSMCCMHM